MATKANNTNLDAALEEANKDLGNSAPVVEEPKGSVEAVSLQKYNQLELKRKKLVSVYSEEEKVPVTISPFYAPYLGRVVRESVNGIFVDVPADGKTYKINKTHAGHIIAKIKRIDAMLEHQKRMGDTANNLEYAPGELHL